MLPLSGFTITFKRSRDHLRSALLIHACAAVVLLNSSFPVWLILLTMGILLILLTSTVRYCLQMPEYIHLVHHPGYWLLHRFNGEIMRFETMSVSFDAGFFVLLTLSKENVRKTWVIFHDQITKEQWRALKLTSRDSVNSSN